jgi:uncharacterized protein DUF2800
MTAGHAYLSPSAAFRWTVCPGSVALSAGMPDRTTLAAERGTACHAALAARIEKRREPELSAEEQGWVLLVYDWLMLYESLADGGLRMVEQPLRAGTFFGCPDELWGTPDYVFVHGKQGRAALVIDAKFGYVEVEIEDNLQLLLYALGVAEHFNWELDFYTLGIFQPQVRSLPSTVVYTPEQLRAEARRLIPRVRAALEPQAALVPTKRGCDMCPAASVCPALREQVTVWSQRAMRKPEEVDPEVLATILERAPLIRKALDTYESYAKQSLALGRVVPGWKRVATKGHRKWKDEKEAEDTLKLLIDDESKLWTRSLVSPAQAEKLIKLPRKTMDGLTFKPDNEPALVRESDPRPALDAAFKRLEGHENDGE